MSMIRRTIALQLAYQRRLGQLQREDISPLEEEVMNKEEEARKWAEQNYREDQFMSEAEKIIELL